MNAYHYELPDGSISAAFDDAYSAFLAGCRATWNTELDMNWVRVFDGADGAYVPSWKYCDDCNYVRHICPGCGNYLRHEQGGVCAECLVDLQEGGVRA